MEYIDLNLRGPQAGESGVYQNRGKTEWKFNGASGSSTGFQRSTPERSPRNQRRGESKVLQGFTARRLWLAQGCRVSNEPGQGGGTRLRFLSAVPLLCFSWVIS